jgi:class 3 adenylate cyclase
VRESDVVLVCLSRGSINKRGYVQREIKSALDVADEQPEGSVFLIPLRLEDCDVPERLTRWHWVNLFEESGYARLLRSLRSCSTKIGIEPSQSGETGDFRGVHQVISVLFADIREFVTLSESTPPNQVVELLRKFHAATLGVISEHRGTLNKYLGGGLMAVFGVPAPERGDAARAVEAAVAMQRQMARLNEELDVMGLPEIRIGIGIHTGEATVGYIGTEKHSDYTVIGGTVTLAARLEANSKAGQILISEATAIRAKETKWPLHPLQPLVVRNREEPVLPFEVDWQHEQRE